MWPWLLAIGQDRAGFLSNDYLENLTGADIHNADALRPEYEAIVRAGFVLQLDCPDLAMERHTSFADKPLADFVEFVEQVVTAINRALAGLPRERVRMHVCWGNYEAPHTLDVPLDDILPRLYRADVGSGGSATLTRVSSGSGT